MPPTPFADLSAIDLSAVEATRDDIYKLLPHRHEFMQLDGIVKFDRENLIGIGYRDLREDEWWCKGHLPGRPIFPGVMMVEAAAHLSTYCYLKLIEKEGFLGFAGIESVKFRGAVVPPARMYLVGKSVEAKPRRMICDVQGFLDGTMVFEARIIGMPM